MKLSQIRAMTGCYHGNIRKKLASQRADNPQLVAVNDIWVKLMNRILKYFGKSRFIFVEVLLGKVAKSVLSYGMTSLIPVMGRKHQLDESLQTWICLARYIQCHTTIRANTCKQIIVITTSGGFANHSLHIYTATG